MGFGVRLEITSSRDLINSLTLLESKAPAAAARALGKAMKIARKSAVALAPKDTGLLKKALVSKAYVTRDKSAVIGELKTSHMPSMVQRRGKKKATKADPYYYAHLVELGTKAHAVGSGSQLWKKRPSKSGAGIPGVQRGSRHPGSRPKPFLNRALTDNQATIEAVLERELDRELQKLWEKS